MTKQKFKPFVHEDLELKNTLIDFARNASKKQDAESQLGSAMVYASFAEYIAGHILDTLRDLMYQTTYRDFAGILFVDQRKSRKPLTMGQKAKLLEDYEFPDKVAVLETLDAIARSRNNLFHNFAASDVKGLEALDEDIATIRDRTEELFTKVNTIYAGLQKIVLSPDQATSINP